MNKLRKLATFLVCLSTLVACNALPIIPTPTQTPGPIPISDLDYDSQPDTIVVYVEIHYPGVPRPTTPANKCYRPFLPALRIWGDGLVYLDEHIINRRSWVLAGKIDREQLTRVLVYLNSQNFFTEWEHTGLNPAGTSLKIGATLKNKPVNEYETGDLSPMVYREIVKIVKPELAYLSPQNPAETRVEQILQQNEGCNPVSSTRRESPGQLTYVADMSSSYKIVVVGSDSKPTPLTSSATSEYQPTWSPDGREVAFVADNYIFKMNADGTRKTQLTTQLGQDRDPAWSPLGGLIAFVSSRNGKSEIYTMTRDGNEQTQLTQSTTLNSYPSWSPDSSQIAFTCGVIGVVSNICVINRDGTNLRTLTQEGFNVRPAWSPDGKKIAFVFLESLGNLDIYTMNADGTGRVNLTNDPGRDDFPAWSPDGRKIAFVTSNRVGSPDTAYMGGKGGNFEVFVMNSDGSNPINITNNGYHDLSPAWRP